MKDSDSDPLKVPGTLYIVATPIGNLGDVSARALQILKQVDLIAAEDTRHSGGFLNHYSISTSMTAYHDHNEAHASGKLIAMLEQGKNIALISDAGTPLIADPGFSLVQKVRERGLQAVSVPGACAIITALAASGLPTDRFSFEGFLPAKQEARRKRLASLLTCSQTLIFYEAPHRILATFEALKTVFGGQRKAVLARELTKRYETYLSGTLDDICGQLYADLNQQRGEMVILLHGAEECDDQQQIDQRADAILQILVDEDLPVKQVSVIAAKITGMKKNYLYGRALRLVELKSM